MSNLNSFHRRGVDFLLSQPHRCYLFSFSPGVGLASVNEKGSKLNLWRIREEILKNGIGFGDKTGKTF